MSLGSVYISREESACSNRSRIYSFVILLGRWRGSGVVEFSRNGLTAIDIDESFAVIGFEDECLVKN